MDIYRWYKDLPPWAKGVTVVLTAGVSIVVLWKTYGIVDAAIAKAKAKRTLTDVNNDLDTLHSQGQKPTYSESQYKIWADAAEQCFQGWGTCSGDTIWVNMKNDTDILMLIKAYGVRTISSGKWNPEPDLVGDLPVAIRSELPGESIQALNESLVEKGIKYQF